MTCKVKVENGTIRLPSGVKLPDGTEVQLTIPEPALTNSFADRYATYVGAADDLPADLAEKLDHYVHGHRKK
jgi:hypothetical protein